MTLFCGWYSDRKVRVRSLVFKSVMMARDNKNERMIPIVIANLPTILGTGQLENIFVEKLLIIQKHF